MADEVAPRVNNFPPPAPHTDPWKTCARCWPKSGKGPIRFSDGYGNPLGPGGDTVGCEWCGSCHLHGNPCDVEGLRARGWRTNGHDKLGRVRWLSPEQLAQKLKMESERGKRKRAAAKRREVVVPVLPSEVVEVLTDARDVKVQARMRGALLDLPAPRSSDFETLDVQTSELWLKLARARRAGLTVSQVAAIYNLDETLVERLAHSPSYQHFEATYRRVESSDSPLRQQIEELMWENALAAQKAIKWALDLVKGDDETAVKALPSIVVAAKAASSAVGITMERKQVDGRVLHAHLTPARSEKLIAALERMGA